MQRIGVLLGGPADFAGWRNQARRLLAAEVPPEAVEWRVPGEAPGLLTTGAAPDTATLHATTNSSEGRMAGGTATKPTADTAAPMKRPV